MAGPGSMDVMLFIAAKLSEVVMSLQLLVASVALVSVSVLGCKLVDLIRDRKKGQ